MGAQSSPTDLRRTLEAGDVAIGALENAYNPDLVELYGALGLDFVWLDLEHGGPSPRSADHLNEFLRAAEAGGTELLVRIPTPEPDLVRKALDAGVRSLFVSRVETADDVRQAVRAARFSYDGEPGDRGLASPRASRWGLADDYVAREDEETLVGATIENPTAVDNLEDILAVPELGFVFVGPLDLSVSLAHPGELDHPDVQEAEESIRAASIDAGVPVGGLGFGMEDVNEKADAGYQILNLGSTTGALGSVVSGWLDEYRADG